MNLSALIFAVTITFSPFAGIIAYFITLDEYQHHFDSKKRARRQALNMALFSFAVILITGLTIGYVFGQIAANSH